MRPGLSGSARHRYHVGKVTTAKVTVAARVSTKAPSGACERSSTEGTTETPAQNNRYAERKAASFQAGRGRRGASGCMTGDLRVERSVLDADAAERHVADDAQARRRAGPLRGARHVVRAAEEGGHVQLDLPSVRHAN